MSDLLPLFMCMVPNGHNMVILPLAKSSTWRYFSWSNTVSSGGRARNGDDSEFSEQILYYCCVGCHLNGELTRCDIGSGGGSSNCVLWRQAGSFERYTGNFMHVFGNS